MAAVRRSFTVTPPDDAEVMSAESYSVLDTETPDYVEKISRFLESSVPHRTQVSNEPAEAESDSGDSLFLTQKPVPEAVRSQRRLRSRTERTERSKPATPRSLEESGSDSDSSSSSSSLHQEYKTVKGNKLKKYCLPKYSFPFLSGRKWKPQSSLLPSKENRSLHYATLGGFFSCVREQWRACPGGDHEESSLPTVDVEGECISPLTESEDERSEDDDMKIVDKKDFASPSKANRRQTWCRQSTQRREKAAHAGPETARTKRQENQTKNSKTKNQSETRRSLFKEKTREEELSDDSDVTDCELPAQYTNAPEPQTDVVPIDDLSQTGQTEEQPEAQHVPHCNSDDNREYNQTRLKSRENSERDGDHQSGEEEISHGQDEPEGLHAAPSVSVHVEETRRQSQENIAEPPVLQACEVLEFNEINRMENAPHDDPRQCMNAPQPQTDVVPMDDLSQTGQTEEQPVVPQGDSDDNREYNQTRLKSRENGESDGDHQSVEEESSRGLDEPEGLHAASSVSVNVEETRRQSQENIAEPPALQACEVLEFNEINCMENALHDGQIEREEERETPDSKQRKKKRKKSLAGDVGQEVDGNLESDMKLADCSGVESDGKEKRKKKRKKGGDGDEGDEQTDVVTEPLNDYAEIQRKKKKKKKEKTDIPDEQVEEEPSNRTLTLLPVSDGQLEESIHFVENTAASQDAPINEHAEVQRKKKKKRKEKNVITSKYEEKDMSNRTLNLPAVSDGQLEESAHFVENTVTSQDTPLNNHAEVQRKKKKKRKEKTVITDKYEEKEPSNRTLNLPAVSAKQLEESAHFVENTLTSQDTPLNNHVEVQRKKKKKRKEKTVITDKYEEEEPSNRTLNLPAVSAGQLEESIHFVENTAASQDAPINDHAEVQRKKKKKRKEKNVITSKYEEKDMSNRTLNLPAVAAKQLEESAHFVENTVTSQDTPLNNHVEVQRKKKKKRKEKTVITDEQAEEQPSNRTLNLPAVSAGQLEQLEESAHFEENTASSQDTPLIDPAEVQRKKKKKWKEKTVITYEYEEEEPSNRTLNLPAVAVKQLEESAHLVENIQDTLESSFVKRKKHKKKHRSSSNDAAQDGAEGEGVSICDDAGALQEGTVSPKKKKKKKEILVDTSYRPDNNEMIKNVDSMENTPEGLEDQSAEFVTKKKKKKKDKTKKGIPEGVDASYTLGGNEMVEDVDDTEKTHSGLVDQSAELVIKKKKKKKSKISSSNISEDSVAQSNDSVSVQEKEKTRTASFLTADAEENDAETHQEQNRVKKKNRKRKTSAQQDSVERDHEQDFEEPKRTCLRTLPETADTGVKRKQEHEENKGESETPVEQSDSRADGGSPLTDEALMMMKKKKKKKKKVKGRGTS